MLTHQELYESFNNISTYDVPFDWEAYKTLPVYDFPTVNGEPQPPPNSTGD